LYAVNYRDLLSADKGALIIDLGCSEGWMLAWLRDRGYTNLWGADSDRGAVEQAREAIGEGSDSSRVVVADIADFLRDQPDDHADAVFLNNVIEHLDHDYALDLAAEARRVLKPGGVFVATTGNMENPFNMGLFSRDFTHRVFFSANSLRQMFILAGFEPARVTVRPIRYRTTLRNLPVQWLAPVMGSALKLVARSMRIRIEETAPLICATGRA
jgi:SAM-dependent methyltransferase